MRGLFTCGVNDVLMENGIEFDGAIGVSAGATFGCNYKSNQPGRAIRYNKRFAHDWRYSSLLSWFKTGDLFGADFDYRILPTTLDKFDTEAFAANPMEFYIVCTEVETARPIYYKMKTGDEVELEWMRGSASMPVASNVVHVEGYDLLDGGIIDSIPIRYFESIGYKHNLVILTQPRDFVMKPQKGAPVLKRVLREYPAVFDALQNRYKDYNEVRSYIWETEKQGRNFVICPPAPLPIHHVSHDPEEMQTVYEIGREAAEVRLDEIKAFLED